MRLLDLQGIDTRLDQIAHARATLPTIEAIRAAQTQLGHLDTDLVNARTASGDVQLELAKAEQDVTLVRDRAARNQSRLDSGSGTAKDLSALQHELTSLARRQAELEETQLEVMERAETLGSQVEQLAARRDQAAAEVARLQAEHDAALAGLEAEATTISAGRDEVVGDVGADLVELYEKVRTQSGGLAAAELKARRCGGCRLELTPTDMDRIRRALSDEVLRCEECRRIMVRTAESGL